MKAGTIAGQIERERNRIHERYSAEFHAQGLPARTVDLLMSLVDDLVAIEFRKLEDPRTPGSTETVGRIEGAPVNEFDPGKLFTATEFGEHLGISDETVRRREQNGELFSILKPARKRGREFPAFQTDEHIWGEPLKRTLAALGYTPSSGAAAYGFFTSQNDLLGGLTPIELLLGRLLPEREIEEEVRSLLFSSPSRRQKLVEETAEAYGSVLAQ